MISLTFRGDTTLFQDVVKLPAGSMLTFSNAGIAVERYWQMSFAVVKRDADSLLQECDSKLEQSIQRILRTPKRKVLFLSGGVDSRVILGYLRLHLEASQIHTAFYGSELSDGDDAVVAQMLAETFGFERRGFIVRLTDFLSTAPAAALKCDCRSEVLDSAPLYQFVDVLSQEYDAYINGDECFGWHRNVGSVQEALNEIGWFGLDQVCRLGDWLNPKISKQVQEEIRTHLSDIVCQAAEANPDDLKDKLYYEERLGNMLNGFAWAKLHRLEGFRPLIDEDVIDFLCTVPNEWRGDKRLLRSLLKTKFPDFTSLPFSKGNALPTPQMFRDFLCSNKECKRFFREQLTERLDPRLSTIFSTKQFKESVTAILNGASLPPISRNWLSRIPGFWRLAKTPENRVDPFSLVLRLIQLNLHLSSFE